LACLASGDVEYGGMLLPLAFYAGLEPDKKEAELKLLPKKDLPGNRSGDP
jgi:hypothetical protein